MKRVIAIALTATLGWVGAASTQETAPLSPGESMPGALGWMQGFPPPADKVIRNSDADHAAFPKLRWTMCHFRQLMPTVGVDNGPGDDRRLPEASKPGLGEVSFTPIGSDDTMTWDDAFDANYTDGVIVLHHGRIVYERYDGCLDRTVLHGAMSVTDSLTGLLAEILVAEGALDETARVGDLIPELADSGFGDSTVRQVMNMTTALGDPDGNAAPQSDLGRLRTVPRDGKHGTAFDHRRINADALGWLIARATGKSVPELLSDRIWRHLGARREAFYTVDSTGTPDAGSGFNATLRDMARLGQMMLNGGRVDREQLVPQDAVAAITAGGDGDAFAEAGHDLLPGWSYRSMWWVSGGDHGTYAARGAHGQTIWIDPVADMVIARFASHPEASNAASDPTSLPAYRAVAEYLIAHDDMPLAGREWLIEDVEGMGVIDYSHATLKFLPDGALAGSATCNRLTGSYEVAGDALTIQPTGVTMMACPEALMAQEQRILDLLPKIERYVIDETGALILIAADGRTIAARR